jgi:ribonuclease HI
MKAVKLFCDGSGTSNAPGGWGAVLIHGEYIRMISGHASDTTNNRMELTAAIRGLSAIALPCKVELVSDSEYIVLPIANGSLRRGWLGKKNTDLWEQLRDAVGRHSVKARWVRGHSGNLGNEICDLLAGVARKSKMTLDTRLVGDLATALGRAQFLIAPAPRELHPV